MTPLPDSVAIKLRSGTLSTSEAAERIRFWKARGADCSEFETPEVLAAVEALTPAPPVPAPKPELTEEQAAAKFPCVHRVPTDREHVCAPCRGKRVHTICECKLFKRECTVRASDAKQDGKPVLTCLACDDREAPACPHLSKGCCGLAAVLAAVPVNTCPVKQDQCSACLRGGTIPEVETPTETVKDIALRAAHQWQPLRAERVGKALGINRRKWTASTAGYLKDRGGRTVEIGGLYRGATVFLVCGGPSLNKMDLTPLRAERGILVAAVNQVAATHVRPQLWFSVDDPSKFHESIWKDPGILCFTKQKYLRHAVWETKDGERKAGPKSQDLPGVLGYEHRSEWPCDFLSGAPTWGTAGVFKSVFMVALRMLADLGVKRICLLGADFHMEPGQSYAFDQEKNAGAARSNNGYYARMNRDLPKVWKDLLSIGCEVVNCTPGSHLTAFPTSTLADELARVVITPPASVAGLY